MKGIFTALFAAVLAGTLATPSEAFSGDTPWGGQVEISYQHGDGLFFMNFTRMDKG